MVRGQDGLRRDGTRRLVEVVAVMVAAERALSDAMVPRNEWIQSIL